MNRWDAFTTEELTALWFNLSLDGGGAWKKTKTALYREVRTELDRRPDYKPYDTVFIPPPQPHHTL